MNFEKPLSEFSEEELQKRINQVDPRFGVLLSYELLRRIEIENAKSSQRFGTWSLVVSIASILIALWIGWIQIYLAKIQVDPILAEQYRTEKNSYEFCKEPGNWNPSDGGATPGSDCKEKYIILKNKFGQYPSAEQALKSK